MKIKTVYVEAGGGFDRVVIGTSEPRAPGAGEVTEVGPDVKAFAVRERPTEIRRDGPGPGDRRCFDLCLATGEAGWRASDRHLIQ